MPGLRFGKPDGNAHRDITDTYDKTLSYDLVGRCLASWTGRACPCYRKSCTFRLARFRLSVTTVFAGLHSTYRASLHRGDHEDISESDRRLRCALIAALCR